MLEAPPRQIGIKKAVRHRKELTPNQKSMQELRVVQVNEKTLAKYKSLKGQKFSYLEVLDVKIMNRRVLAIAQCICGSIDYYPPNYLTENHYKSCGCKRFKANEFTEFEQMLKHSLWNMRVFNKSMGVIYEPWQGKDGITDFANFIQSLLNAFPKELHDNKFFVRRKCASEGYVPSNIYLSICQTKRDKTKRTSKTYRKAVAYEPPKWIENESQLSLKNINTKIAKIKATRPNIENKKLNELLALFFETNIKTIIKIRSEG